jgi:hypothetical protein
MSFVKEQNYTPFFTPYVQGISPEFKELQQRLIKDYDDTFAGYTKFKTAAEQMTALEADAEKRKVILDEVRTSFDEAASSGDYENRMRILQKQIGKFEADYRPIMEQFQRKKLHEDEVAKKVQTGFYSAEHAKEELKIAEKLYGDNGGITRDEFGNLVNTYNDNYNKAIRPKDISLVDVTNKIISLKMSHPNAFAGGIGSFVNVGGKLKKVTESGEIIEVTREELYTLAKSAATFDPDLKAYFNYVGFAATKLYDEELQFNMVQNFLAEVGKTVMPDGLSLEQQAEERSKGFITKEEYQKLVDQANNEDPEIALKTKDYIISEIVKDGEIAGFANHSGLYAYQKYKELTNDLLSQSANLNGNGGGTDGVTVPNVVSTTIADSGTTVTNTYNDIKNQINSLAAENVAIAAANAISKNSLFKFLPDDVKRKEYVDEEAVGILNQIDDTRLTKLEELHSSLIGDMPKNINTPEDIASYQAEKAAKDIEKLTQAGFAVNSEADVQSVRIYLAELINQRNNVQRNSFSLEAVKGFYDKTMEAYQVKGDDNPYLAPNGGYRDNFASYYHSGDMSRIELHKRYILDAIPEIFEGDPNRDNLGVSGDKKVTNQVMHEAIKRYGNIDGFDSAKLDEIKTRMIKAGVASMTTDEVAKTLDNQAKSYYKKAKDTLDSKVEKDPTLINFSLSDFVVLANEGSVFKELEKLFDNKTLNDQTSVVGGVGVTNIKTHLEELSIPQSDLKGELKRIDNPKLNLTPQFNSVTGSYGYTMESLISYNPDKKPVVIREFVTDNSIVQDAMVRYYFNIHDKEKGEAPYQASEVNRGQIALSYGFYTLEKSANTLISSGKLKETTKPVPIKSKNGFEFRIMTTGGSKYLEIKGQDGNYTPVRTSNGDLALYSNQNLQPMIEKIGEIELHYLFRTKHSQQYNEYLSKFSGGKPNVTGNPVSLKDVNTLTK